MCTQRAARRPRADRERVVEVLGGVRVDRERGQVAQVDAALEGRIAGGSYGSNAARAPCSTSSPSSTASIELAGPSTRSTRARPRPVRTTARSPGPASLQRPCGRARAASRARSTARRRRASRASRPRRRRRLAHGRRGTCSSDLEEAAERQPGAERRRGASRRRAGSAPLSSNGQRVHVARPRRASGSAAQHELLARARAGCTASTAPAKPAEQPFDHERPADEPVRRADELHHLDLASPREDREPDRVRDQQRRGDEQHDDRDQEDDLEITRADLERRALATSSRRRLDRRATPDAGSGRELRSRSSSMSSASSGMISNASGSGLHGQPVDQLRVLLLHRSRAPPPSRRTDAA